MHRSLPHVSGPAWLRPAALLAAFCVTYFLGAKLGIATAMPPEGIVILWPSNALVMAVLLAVQPNRWWILFLATLGTEVAADIPDYPLWAAIGYGLVNFSEAALAASLLLRFGKDRGLIASPLDFVRFVAIGPFLASGLAALGGALLYKFGAPEVSYLHYWRVFWMGDATGLLILGTALVAWKRPPLPPQQWFWRRLLEAAFVTLLLLLVSGWAFLGDADLPRVYAIFPVLVWTALRFGVRATVLAVVTVAAVAIGSAVNGLGPFVNLSNIGAVLALQGLIAVTASSMFILAFSTEAALRTNAALTEANRKLEQMNRELDQIVARKTGKLRRLLAHNEMLLQEVHHRVKNNLQIVSSIISVHSRGVHAADPQTVFSEVQKQIGAIVVAYDMLQQVETGQAVDFSRIVRKLCRTIDEAGGGLVQISTQAEDGAWVAPDVAAVLSLAVNELVTNSIKHMLREESAMVRVRCCRDGNHVVVGVTDNGPGFPPDFDLETARGFGMRMTRKIVDQVGGSIRTLPDARGAAVEIRVPAATAPAEG